MLRATLLLLLLLAAGCGAPPVAVEPAALQQVERFAPLSDASAWERLARSTPPLPSWARMLAESLPHTTALQLDLDHRHRVENPLGPLFAARLRWVVAQTNQCTYAKQSAESDLERAGVAAELTQRLGDPSEWSPDERVALDFARKLTLDGASITDNEFDELLAAYGADDAVAIVHTVAHANFQNRIFLALGLTSEPAGASPPLELGSTSVSTLAPPRPPLPASIAARAEVDHPQAPWSDHSFDQLRERLGSQKERALRIPLPDAVRLARLPRPDRARVAGTVWGKVSMGYQPVLTTSWFRTMRAFDGEAQLDDVFANTVFWVITRENDCFY